MFPTASPFLSSISFCFTFHFLFSIFLSYLISTIPFSFLVRLLHHVSNLNCCHQDYTPVWVSHSLLVLLSSPCYHSLSRLPSWRGRVSSSLSPTVHPDCYVSIASLVGNRHSLSLFVLPLTLRKTTHLLASSLHSYPLVFLRVVSVHNQRHAEAYEGQQLKPPPLQRTSGDTRSTPQLCRHVQRTPLHVGLLFRCPDRFRPYSTPDRAVRAVHDRRARHARSRTGTAAAAIGATPSLIGCLV